MVLIIIILARYTNLLPKGNRSKDVESHIEDGTEDDRDCEENTLEYSL